MKTEVSGFDTLHGHEDFFFSTVTTLVVESIQLSKECVWDGLSQDVKQSEREANHTI